MKPTRITWKERDAIVAALRANPDDVEGVARRFGRSLSTVAKLRQKAQLTSWSRKEQLLRHRLVAGC
ncbi:MAG TPA: hypothetical protein VNT25_04255 [Allosphingosinicella sp.]|nr:hypothetical protein [Allosphingosinicella sp.]